MRPSPLARAPHSLRRACLPDPHRSPTTASRPSPLSCAPPRPVVPCAQAKPFAQKFSNASPAALALLQRLLAFDPLDRPTAAEALADPYFASLPNATAQEPARYSRQVFEFETRKKPLDTAEVRALIYQEVSAPCWR